MFCCKSDNKFSIIRHFPLLVSVWEKLGLIYHEEVSKSLVLVIHKFLQKEEGQQRILFECFELYPALILKAPKDQMGLALVILGFYCVVKDS